MGKPRGQKGSTCHIHVTHKPTKLRRVPPMRRLLLHAARLTTATLPSCSRAARATLTTMTSKASATELPEELLFCVENPLLDISANVDPAFLKKYGLEANGALLAHKAHEKILRELQEHHKDKLLYIAGGSVQNSARVAAWILGKPKVVTFMGSIGDDEYGAILREYAEADGLNTKFEVQQGTPTGTCAVLLTGTDRSLCAKLDASQLLSMDFFMSSENVECWQKARFFYTSGFFLTSDGNWNKFQEIGRYAVSTNAPILFNLSAEYIQTQYAGLIKELMPYVDVLFGNAAEIKAFSITQKLSTNDLIEIGRKIIALPKKRPRSARVIIITQGSGPVIAVSKNKVESFKVIKMKKEQIKDTNGCGDALVGGFLSQYIQGKPIEACVKCGIWAASQVIQCSGCQFPKEKRYDETAMAGGSGKCCGRGGGGCTLA